MRTLEYHGPEDRIFTNLADGRDRKVSRGETISVPDEVAVQLERTELFSPVTTEEKNEAPNPKKRS